jgi:hypothetical protein
MRVARVPYAIDKYNIRRNNKKVQRRKEKKGNTLFLGFFEKHPRKKIERKFGLKMSQPNSNRYLVGTPQDESPSSRARTDSNES